MSKFARFIAVIVFASIMTLGTVFIVSLGALWEWNVVYVLGAFYLCFGGLLFMSTGRYELSFTRSANTGALSYQLKRHGLLGASSISSGFFPEDMKVVIKKDLSGDAPFPRYLALCLINPKSGFEFIPFWVQYLKQARKHKQTLDWYLITPSQEKVSVEEPESCFVELLLICLGIGLIIVSRYTAAI